MTTWNAHPLLSERRREFLGAPMHALTMDETLALANEDRPIADIALSCGFCDQSALSRQFKQLTGLTPREYRLMMRGGSTD